MLKKIAYEKQLGNKFPEIAKEWHPTKNGNLTPKEIHKGSNKKVWWQCSKGHDWEARVYTRSSGTKCPYCSGNRLTIENSLAFVYPEIAAEWHPIKNDPLFR